MLIGPFVPNSHPVFLEVGDVGVPFQKPQQLMNDGTEVQLFGREHRKAFRQVEPHLISKTPQCPSACAVFTLHSVVQEVRQ